MCIANVFSQCQSWPNYQPKTSDLRKKSLLVINLFHKQVHIPSHQLKNVLSCLSKENLLKAHPANFFGSPSFRTSALLMPSAPQRMDRCFNPPQQFLINGDSNSNHPILLHILIRLFRLQLKCIHLTSHLLI